ncbi:MAG: YaeQ family protein [Hahellaceae bacterium]|nr:YaeQ family protein [Hahellaceae bacterium]MCP5212635.1 YaeQ family protein [Hahellaceae bacterium]
MALKATIFKAELQISDMDRNYYASHDLTIARHPSETDERMMLRILAFALHASEHLSFTKGISTDDEPDLWSKNLSGEIELWIELGQPDEKRVRKGCGRAKSVIVYSFAGNAGDIWWQQNRSKLERYSNLMVMAIAEAQRKTLTTLTHRTMKLQCTIQDGTVWLSDDSHNIEVTPTYLKRLD